MPNPNYPVVPTPVSHDPSQIVANVFEDVAGVPDLDSRAIAEYYLGERYTDPADGGVIAVQTGTSRVFGPHFHKEPHAYKFRYIERDREHPWIVSPRTSAIVSGFGTALATLVFNTPNLFRDAADEGRQAIYDINQVLNPPVDTIITIAVPREVPATYEHVSIDLEHTNEPGVSTPDAQKIRRFVSRFQGKEITGAIVVGDSSDDYGSDATIGVKEPADQDFADERAAAAGQVVSEALGAIGSGARVETKVNQDVVSAEDKDFLKSLSKNFGYNSITEAIRAVEDGTETRAELVETIDNYFTSKRGTTITLITKEIDTPASVEYEEVPMIIPAQNPPRPDNPKRDYEPELLVVPPIPQGRIRHGSMLSWRRRLHLWKNKPEFEYIELEPDETLVRLRPEVLNADGTFADEPWAHTRKFEHLVRDDRIQHVLKADWQNSKGEAKTMRVFFVDESPNEEALELFKAVMSRIANMDDGKVADRLSAVFVHPTAQAGRTPRHIKRIGPSIDQQEETPDMLGYCMPFMRLVELHMPHPSQATEEELMDMANGIWTLSHELAGHGNQIDDTVVNRLTQIGYNTYRSANLFSNPGAAMARDTLPLDPTDPTYFDMGHTALDRQGRPVQRRVISELGDYSLTHAIDASIIGERPTLYANTSDHEHHAEVAASVTTGILVPFSHIGRTRQVRGDRTVDGETPDFTPGYLADVGSQEIFTNQVGGLSGSVPIEFVNPARLAFSYTRPRFDPQTRQRIVDAKSRRFPMPNELIRVIGRVRS